MYAYLLFLTLAFNTAISASNKDLVKKYATVMVDNQDSLDPKKDWTHWAAAFAARDDFEFTTDVPKSSMTPSQKYYLLAKNFSYMRDLKINILYLELWSFSFCDEIDEFKRGEHNQDPEIFELRKNAFDAANYFLDEAISYYESGDDKSGDLLIKIAKAFSTVIKKTEKQFK